MIFTLLIIWAGGLPVSLALLGFVLRYYEIKNPSDWTIVILAITLWPITLLLVFFERVKQVFLRIYVFFLYKRMDKDKK